MTKVEKYIIDNIDKTIRENKKDEGTLIGLPGKYIVPCVSEHYQEMYYWDSFFACVGLKRIGRFDVVKSTCENMAYLVEKYGLVPNGSRTYFLNRSQPPFFSELVKTVYNEIKDKLWLKKMYPAVCKEWAFWDENRKDKCGLNFYKGDKISESNYGLHIDYFYSRFKVKPEEVKSTQQAVHYTQGYMACCESGYDCTFRNGYDNADYCHIDLNSLLYLTETNLSYFADELNNGDTEKWQKAAENRKELINKLMWNGFFTDYNYKTGESGKYFAIPSVYPLYAKIATESQAAQTVEYLKELEFNYGLAGTKNENFKVTCQWDYPLGWACQQYMAVYGLINYGYTDYALSLAEKYLKLVEKVFDETGETYEKYNVVEGKNAVGIEYDARVMLGWTAGVYLNFSDLLSK